MNRYGVLAMRHWEQHAPSRVRVMTDRVGFFTDLGVQVQAAVVDLAQSLATSAPTQETYLETLGRLRMARMQAEEIVLRELVWINSPELPLDQAREEWEQTRTSDEWLAGWAARIQDAPETEPATVELEQLAKDWAVPVEFLEELLAAESPYQFLRDNQAAMAEAANVRFLRELR